MKTRIVAAVFAIAAASVHATVEVAPDVLARSVTDEVMTIVRTDKRQEPGSQQLARLVESKVLPHFNFTHMTQLAAGRNWRLATPDQQQLLVDEFRTLLVRTYTTAFMQYKDWTIDYKPLRMVASDNEVVVKSLIRQPAGQPIAIDYGMEKLADGWKVYDVRIEGMSLIENYRSTFNSVIQKSGVEGLIKTLSEKNKNVSAQNALR